MCVLGCHVRLARLDGRAALSVPACSRHPACSRRRVKGWAFPECSARRLLPDLCLPECIVYAACRRLCCSSSGGHSGREEPPSEASCPLWAKLAALGRDRSPPPSLGAASEARPPSLSAGCARARGRRSKVSSLPPSLLAAPTQPHLSEASQKEAGGGGRERGRRVASQPNRHNCSPCLPVTAVQVRTEKPASGGLAGLAFANRKPALIFVACVCVCVWWWLFFFFARIHHIIRTCVFLFLFPAVFLLAL